MNLTWTQLCVLKVLDERGGCAPWRVVARDIRDRSGRTVRPSHATLNSLSHRGLVKLTILGALLTANGRAVLSAASQAASEDGR